MYDSPPPPSIAIRDMLSRLKKQSLLQKKKKAAPISTEQVKNLLDRLGEEDATLLQAAYMTTGRVGNLQHIDTFSILPNNQIQIEWSHHKTMMTVGAKIVQITVPRSLYKHLKVAKKKNKNPFPKATSTLTKILRREGWGLHSFRRGSIQALLDQGTPEETVRILSCHKTVEAMLQYADRAPRAKQTSSATKRLAKSLQ
jgi:hypothetical protein